MFLGSSHLGKYFKLRGSVSLRNEKFLCKQRRMHRPNAVYGTNKDIMVAAILTR